MHKFPNHYTYSLTSTQIVKTLHNASKRAAEPAYPMTTPATDNNYSGTHTKH